MRIGETKLSWTAVLAFILVAGCGGATSQPAQPAGPKTYEMMSLKTIKALRPVDKWVEVEALISFVETTTTVAPNCPNSIFYRLAIPGTEEDAGMMWVVVPKSQYALVEDIQPGDLVSIKGYLTAECGEPHVRKDWRWIKADSVKKQ